ncbi:DoxX family protein [Vulgatibacter incomptus]|uniref:Putative integral membrane protein n=1 Tax=Vulgatibacter incomptus TaxID=1391653 RepID=A0A0K1PFI2_9BACT|nr:DoxX family protein [Vulgatibacter incomptus]AKU92288.1 putative integral membrane protein [Vulgatibacter incomptus]
MSATTISPRSIGWAVLRIAVGAMFVTHGYAKIFGVTPDGTPQMGQFLLQVSALGLPFPEALAWIAALSELVGGSLVVIGLFTRPAALFALGTMVGALHHHRADAFPQMEKALLFLVVFLVLLIGGSGPFSFDAAKRAKKEKLSLSIFR